jgi:hypothetical protein
LGAPYELNFADMNYPRGFHVWEIGLKELEFLRNPYRMFYKIIYDDREKTLEEILSKASDKFQGTYVKVVVQNRTKPNDFDKFMERLFSLNPADVKIEDNQSLDEGTEDLIVNTAEDTLTILNKYVDSLEIETDKVKVKDELKLLYVEASNMER